MDAKKVLGFLVLKPAFNKRNFSTIGLVGIFIICYILAGGALTLEPPKLPQSDQFGGIKYNNDSHTEGNLFEGSSSPNEIVGNQNSKTRSSMENQMKKPNSLSDSGEQNDPLDPSGLVKGQDPYAAERELKLKKREKKNYDPLDVLSERLKRERD